MPKSNTTDDPPALPADDHIARLQQIVIDLGRRVAQEKHILHLAAIGSVATAWSIFEAAIDVYAVSLAQIKMPVGYCFTAQVIGPARKLDAYIAIARWRGADKFMGTLEGFAKRTAQLAERRNRIIHDPWHIEGDNPASRLEITARRNLRILMVDVPTSAVIKLDSEITAHCQQFIEINRQIEALVGT
jgi:hypothetical protein